MFSYCSGFRVEGSHDGNPHWKEVEMPDPNIKQQPSLYRMHYYNQPHKTFMSYYSPLGPVTISIKSVGSDFHILIYTEKGMELVVQPKRSFYRSFFRLFFGLRPQSYHVIVGVRPELQDYKMVKVDTKEVQEDLIKIHEPEFSNFMKVGLLYCREGQTEETDMLKNITSTASPEYQEFLEFLGDFVELRGFPHYNGGLDTAHGHSGVNSLFARFRDVEVMFHVSTLLPFNPTDHKQIERKKHIGNDRIMIVFNDGRQPYTPNCMKSKQTQIVILVQPIRGEISTSSIAISTPLSPPTNNIEAIGIPETGKQSITTPSSPSYSPSGTRYMVSIANKSDVPDYGPRLPDPPIFSKDETFKTFLFEKMIAGANSVRNSPIFNNKTQREKNIIFLNIINKYTRDQPPELHV